MPQLAAETVETHKGKGNALFSYRDRGNTQGRGSGLFTEIVKTHQTKAVPLATEAVGTQPAKAVKTQPAKAVANGSTMFTSAEIASLRPGTAGPLASAHPPPSCPTSTCAAAASALLDLINHNPR